MRAAVWLVAAVTTGVTISTSGMASATPSEGIDVSTLSQSSLNGTDYVTRELTIAPGGTTGWHYHPGQVFGVIKEGTLTHYDSDCSVDGVYNPGEAISERSGTGYVHEGRNEGSTPLVMWVLYISPAGKPLVVDTPNPGCPFQ
ncbi:cupin domain-containing protein [Mycolicibacterium sp. CH28]|uniref:cupin domain-containing protein n=1 Tax=Mycolicibacterium sp. CH28 TaxID=2512237 RepID=UPI001080C628|nr:cupin domain-containing protein [Mycolicibacterium sp. CH28]TGD85841.1 cupin domain-containing protein [Mycolicibacterium sp. CH28]